MELVDPTWWCARWNELRPWSPITEDDLERHRTSGAFLDLLVDESGDDMGVAFVRPRRGGQPTRATAGIATLDPTVLERLARRVVTRAALHLPPGSSVELVELGHHAKLLAAYRRSGFVEVDRWLRQRLDLRDWTHPTDEGATAAVVTLAERPDLRPQAHRAEVDGARRMPFDIPPPAPSYEQWSDWIEGESGIGWHRYLVLVVGEQASAGVSYAMQDDGSASLFNTWVTARHEGHGHARAVKLHVLSLLAAAGCPSIGTNNQARNERILRHNQRLGFEVEEERVVLRASTT